MIRLLSLDLLLPNENILHRIRGAREIVHHSRRPTLSMLKLQIVLLQPLNQDQFHLDIDQPATRTSVEAGAKVDGLVRYIGEVVLALFRVLCVAHFEEAVRIKGFWVGVDVGVVIELVVRETGLRVGGYMETVLEGVGFDR